MAMDLRDFMLLRCSEMLVMERDIWQMNNMMARECHNPRLKDALERHSEPTRQQISNLEQVVDRLGGMTGPDESPVTQGMMRAHRLFIDMKPPQNLIDINDALEGDKVEHMEIAGYTGLIALARQLGENDIAQLLQQNLQGEEQMRSRVESDLPSLLSELGGSGRMAA